jgi:hypothetical protein
LTNAEHELLVVPLPIRPEMRGQQYDGIYEGVNVALAAKYSVHETSRQGLRLSAVSQVRARKAPGGVTMRVSPQENLAGRSGQCH